MRPTLLAIAFTLSSIAQTPTEPPPLIRIIRSPIPNASHIYADARAAVTVLGMTAITGPSESWFIELHDSFSTIEDLDRAFRNIGSEGPSGALFASDDIIAPSRSMIALYRPAWSYRPEEALKVLPQSHYFQVSIFRNHTGDDAAFAALVRSRSEGLDRINLDRPDLAYEIISGAPSETYLLLSPMASLKTLDNSLAARGQGEAGRSNAAIGREHLLFRIEPRISFVSSEFASVDPGFWLGKPNPE